MNNDQDTTKNSQLIDFLKTIGTVLGVPLGLFAIINTIFQQPIISLVVAGVTLVFLSIGVAYFWKINIAYLAIAWLSFSVIILLGFVIWPKTMTLEGFVNDLEGNPVVNETVKYFDYTGRTYETQTDQVGFYQFVDVPTGKYRIRVHATEIQGETKGIWVRVVQQSISVSPNEVTNVPTPTPEPPTDTPEPLATTFTSEQLPKPPVDTPTPEPTETPTLEPTETPVQDSPSSTPTKEKLKGKVVTVIGAFEGDEAERFKQAMKPFERETGIIVEYEGSQDFGSIIVERVQDGNPPDIAIFPQPGLLADFVNKGHVIDLNTFLDKT